MRDRWLKYGLVAPAVVVVVATTIWPVGYSLLLSLRSWKLSRSSVPGPFIGLENYSWAILEEPAFANSAWVTAVFTFWTVLLTIVTALGIAVLLAPGGRLRLTVRTLLILPFAMSPALIGVSWRFMFNPDFGLFQAFLATIFPPLADVQWLAHPQLAMAVVIMADVWGWTPFITLMFIGGLASVPRETIEAANLDGATGRQTFWHVILPQLRPIIAVAAILKAVFSLKTFDTVFMLTNGGPGTATQTLAHYVYFNGFRYYDMGYASAVAWLMVIPMLILTYYYTRFVFRKKEAG
ncbi:MAG: sugar ABC transporter permease [Pseudomonadota bacterium]